MNKNKKTISIALVIITSLLSIWLFIIRPLNFIGEYPFLLGFSINLLIISTIIYNIYVYSKNENTPLIAAGLGSILIFIGGFIIGWNFNKAKETHLKEYGEIVIATITERRDLSFINKGLKKKQGFEIYYTFKTLENKTVSNWEPVSEEEFYLSKQFESLPVIYSPKYDNVSDLIINDTEKEKYNL